MFPVTCFVSYCASELWIICRMKLQAYWLTTCQSQIISEWVCGFTVRPALPFFNQSGDSKNINWKAWKQDFRNNWVISQYLHFYFSGKNENMKSHGWGDVWCDHLQWCPCQPSYIPPSSQQGQANRSETGRQRSVHLVNLFWMFNLAKLDYLKCSRDAFPHNIRT